MDNDERKHSSLVSSHRIVRYKMLVPHILSTPMAITFETLISDSFLKRAFRKCLQQVPANQKPPCVRNRSQFSCKTMAKTIGYCSKTTGCARKSGFLFAGTRGMLL